MKHILLFLLLAASGLDCSNASIANDKVDSLFYQLDAADSFESDLDESNDDSDDAVAFTLVNPSEKLQLKLTNLSEVFPSPSNYLRFQSRAPPQIPS